MTFSGNRCTTGECAETLPAGHARCLTLARELSTRRGGSAYQPRSRRMRVE
jgi:hypothetical protein